jgi:hypothetical protein
MEILSNAYIAVIPILILIAFLIVARKDKSADAHLKKRVEASIREKSKAISHTASKKSEETVSSLEM